MKTILFSALALLLSACGAGTSSAKIKLARKSSTENNRLFRAADYLGQLHLDESKPLFSSFKIKFIAAYLAEDVDPETQNNIGETQMIYLNPECGGVISDCGLPGSSATNVINNYFDFSDPEQANLDLNAQALPVKVGTYKYVRVEFCKEGATSPNVKYQFEGSTEKDATLNSCGMTSAAVDEPMVIAKGQQVTISLAYDLQEYMQSSATDYGNGQCDDSADISPTPDESNPGSSLWCVGNINMVPSASVE